MNEIVNKFLLAGDKFIPEMHLKQPGFTYSACGPFRVSLNNSEMVKAATLKFCSIQWYLIGDVCAKFGIPYLHQSPDIGQTSIRGISDYQIFGQSLTKRNCQNSWTCHHIDMKLGPVTKPDKRNKTTSKKFDDGRWIPDT